MILNKRVFRMLKENSITYLAILLVIIVSMYAVVGIAGAAQTVIDGVNDHAQKNNVEDGQFTVFQPLTETNISNLKDLGTDVEEHFYLDFSQDDKTVRFYKKRSDIDLVETENSIDKLKNDQIILEKHFCENNNLSVGDNYNIAGYDFEIVALGSSPDYDDVLQNMTDASADHSLFGTAFVNNDTYEKLLKSGKADGIETYEYSYILHEGTTDDDIHDFLDDLTFNIESISDPIAYDYFNKAEKVKTQFSESVSNIVSSGKDLSDSCNKLIDKTSKIATAAGLNDGLKSISEASDSISNGASRLKNAYNDFSNEYLDFSYSNLRSFKTSDDNPRINASSDDIVVNLAGALLAGVIITILIAYILSVFTSNSIEKESKVIGTLFSLGYEKKELLRTYVVLPVLVAFIGGAIGTGLGILSIPSQIKDSSDYYSYPELSVKISILLLCYGIIVPCLISLIVNLVVINKKLSQTPLSMLRKHNNLENGKDLELGKLKYINRFRIKLFYREIKSNITIVLGIFFSLMLLVFAMDIYSAITTLVTETKEDLSFNYMYYLSYPEQDTSKYDADKAYLKQLNSEIYGYDMSVSILGIEKDNRFFDYDIDTNKDEIYVSSSVAYKFDLKEGDEFLLEDKTQGILYKFNVKKIVQYSPGLYVFMDINSMQELFAQNDDYYNALISDEKLDIDSGRVYSITTSDSIKSASETFMSLMKQLIYILIFASVLIFVIVMYLMVRMVIERQQNNISLFKLMGYEDKEISKLYLRNNLYLVIISSLILVPLSKLIMDAIYPSIVANRTVGFNLSYSYEKYVFIFGLIFVSYFISYIMARIRLNKVDTNEVLKDNE